MLCLVVDRGIDGARGSLVLMSNEPMIRGGGPKAWRRLDLADEAQSKPSPLPILLPFPTLPFAPSASSYSSLLVLLLLQAPLAIYLHDQLASRSPAQFCSRSRKIEPRYRVTLFQEHSFSPLHFPRTEEGYEERGTPETVRANFFITAHPDSDQDTLRWEQVRIG